MMRSFFASVLADALAPALARWSQSREREILKSGRPLSEDHIAFARQLGISQPENLRLEITPRIPLPISDRLAALARRIGFPLFHPAGMALGKGISAVSDDPALLRHEIVHLIQYQRLGGHQAFMHAYLFECLSYGYFEAPLEHEAREQSAL
jgi:hypothetical protein